MKNQFLPLCRRQKRSKTMDFEEMLDQYEGITVLENGEYLCVQEWEHPLFVYKLVSCEQELHPFTERRQYNGKIYGLAWIEDEKE